MDYREPPVYMDTDVLVLGGGAAAHDVVVRGFMKVGGDCQAETFSAEGAFTIGGLLTADKIDVKLYGPPPHPDDDYPLIARLLADGLLRGEFAKEFVLESRANRPVLNALERQENEHQVEKVGKELRAMMPWLKKD